MTTKAFDPVLLEEAINRFREPRLEDLTVLEIHDNLGTPEGIPDSDLHVKCRVIFRVGEEVYGADFIRMTDYYVSETGEDCGPFDHIQGDMVVATKLRPTVKVITVYE